MHTNVKFATGLGTFGDQADRFCQSGYKKIKKNVEELFADAAKVKDLSGLELVGTAHVNEKNVNLIKKLKSDYNFQIVDIVIDIFTQSRWGRGTFGTAKPEVRKESIQEVKTYMDIAADLNCNLVDLWFGQDGYDYVFQSDYIHAWENIAAGVAECADYRKDIKIGLEYKPKEPRTHCYIGTIGKALMLIAKVKRDNIGIIIDVGHSFYAYETPAETVALCKLFGDKLYHLHLNDNYRYWDDDMMVGSVHIQEYLELLYWLKKTNYNGWYSFDIFPYREDGISATNECIEWTKSLINAVNSVEEEEIEEVLKRENAVQSLSLMRKMLFR